VGYGIAPFPTPLLDVRMGSNSAVQSLNSNVIIVMYENVNVMDQPKKNVETWQKKLISNMCKLCNSVIVAITEKDQGKVWYPSTP